MSSTPGLSDSLSAQITQAIKKDDLEKFKQLLDGVDLNTATDNKGYPFLFRVINSRSQNILNYMLSLEGFNPNVTLNDETALHFAITKADKGSVEGLLKNPKTDPNLQNSKGATALMLAAAKGDTETVRILLNDSRIDPSVRRKDGSIALSFVDSSSEIYREILGKMQSLAPLGSRGNYQEPIIDLSKQLGIQIEEEGICFGFALQSALSGLVGSAIKPNEGLLSLVKRLQLLPTPNSEEEIDDLTSEYHGDILTLAEEIQSIPQGELGMRFVSPDAPDFERKKALVELEQWLINLSFMHKVQDDRAEKIMPEKQRYQVNILNKEFLSLFVPTAIDPEEFNFSKVRHKAFNSSEETMNWLQNIEGVASEGQKPLSCLLAAGDHAVSITYNPFSEAWTLNDANKGTLPYAKGNLVVVEAILTSLSLVPPFAFLTALMGELNEKDLSNLNENRDDSLLEFLQSHEMKMDCLKKAILLEDHNAVWKILADPRIRIEDVPAAIPYKNLMEIYEASTGRISELSSVLVALNEGVEEEKEELSSKRMLRQEVKYFLDVSAQIKRGDLGFTDEAGESEKISDVLEKYRSISEKFNLFDELDRIFNSRAFNQILQRLQSLGLEGKTEEIEVIRERIDIGDYPIELKEVKEWLLKIQALMAENSHLLEPPVVSHSSATPFRVHLTPGGPVSIHKPDDLTSSPHVAS
jgi:hypothetical protein